MKLIINGNATLIDKGCATLADLLGLPEWKNRRVIAELNGCIVRSEEYGSTALADGDRIELVHFVGGG